MVVEAPSQQTGSGVSLLVSRLMGISPRCPSPSSNNGGFLTSKNKGKNDKKSPYSSWDFLVCSWLVTTIQHESNWNQVQRVQHTCIRVPYFYFLSSRFLLYMLIFPKKAEEFKSNSNGQIVALQARSFHYFGLFWSCWTKKSLMATLFANRKGKWSKYSSAMYNTNILEGFYDLMNVYYCFIRFVYFPARANGPIHLSLWAFAQSPVLVDVVIIAVATIFYMWLSIDTIDGQSWLLCDPWHHKQGLCTYTVGWESIRML